MGLFDSICDVVSAPIKIASSVTEAVVKPIAEGANAVVEEVKDLLD